MKTYLFYDTETTGLNKAFDQILQFAAIRTDERLAEIERHQFTIKLRPDIVVSPGAQITHRITLGELMDGECEYEAARRIHSLVNEPGTISLGYNSLGFDDEFLRFMFYRNLLPPYTHQYARGCRRMDLLPITAIYRLYNPSPLNWPEVNGKPTLKLEQLSTANALAEGRAHDAMVDVEATLALARRLRGSKDMWDYLEGCFVKPTDTHRIANLPETFSSDAGPHPLGVIASSEFGPDLMYQAPVIGIGRSIPYDNQTLWLRLDLPELRETQTAAPDETTWVVRKRLGESPVILPPLERYWQRLGDARIHTAETNLRWLKDHPDLFQKIIGFHRNFSYPSIPDLDADAALYQIGFFSRQTEDICHRFHAASIAEKIDLASSFDTDTTRTLAGRIISRNYPEAMSAGLKKTYQAYLKKTRPVSPDEALTDHKGQKRTTPASALAEIDSLTAAAALDAEQISLLEELKTHINSG